MEKNLEFTIYLIGDGLLRPEIENKIIKYGLTNYVKTLGIQSDIIRLLSQSDIMLLPSFYEGKSISLEEAKILNKPIVITNFSSAKDQINNGVTGLIADMNAVSIADKLIQLIENESLVLNLNNNLKNTIFGTENEISKFYSFISNG